jgi:hypothetical protein
MLFSPSLAICEFSAAVIFWGRAVRITTIFDRFCCVAHAALEGPMTYAIVEAQSAEDLQQKVQTLMDEGWEPQGGLSVGTYAAGVWWYYQAMVRYPTQQTPAQ